MESVPIIRLERPGDRPAIDSLVSSADLPIPRTDEHPVEFLVATTGDELVGCCGWEIHGDQALLRSVVVGAQARSRGVGRRLVLDVVEELRRRDRASVTLVTLDAEGFFGRFGFREIDRDDVSGPIRSSPEFSAHECLGGHWMRLEL